VTLRPRIRPTVRLRLTLLYSALFVTTGAALLAVNYFLVSNRERRSSTAFQVICNAGVPVGNAGPDFLVGNGVAGPPTGCAAQGVTPANIPPGFIGGGSPAQSAPLPDFKAIKRLVTSSQNHTLKTLALESASALGLMSVVSLGLGWLIAGRVLRPIHRITNSARRLSTETLHERINLDGPDDELKELADTFDAMLIRLDRAFSAQRRFAANASHELRTPLATERVLIDEALANEHAGQDELRAILEQLRTNSEESEELINALLVLARSEAGLDRRLPVDLAAVAEQVVEQARAEAVAAGVEIRTSLRPAAVTGDPALLERLIGNLVDNAIRHNLSSGGWVRVEVGTLGEVGGASLRVANSGQVLDPAIVPSLFEPFRRQAGERLSRDAGCGGLGLGLSIVTAVVAAHRGGLGATARPEGGLELEVSLPPAT
jgi:signal transduction histidine kinase